MTSFNSKDLQLSGQGFICSEEILQENIKLQFHQTQFHEVVVPDGEETKRVGWIIPNHFDLLADFTTHTSDGMRGKSTHDQVGEALLIDFEDYLEPIIPDQLMGLDIEESKEILSKMFSEKHKMQSDINLDNFDDDKGLVIISPRSSLVFVQTDDSSVRVSKNGIYVLKRGAKDKLISIDPKDGVNVMGEKTISVGPHGIKIDEKLLDIEAIVDDIEHSIEASLGSLEMLGPMLGNLSGLGGKISKSISKAMSKNFSRNFDDFDDAFDVDIDF